MARLDRKLLMTHPFEGMDPLALLRDAQVLDQASLGVVVAWADELLKASNGKALVRPADTMTVVRGVTNSLLSLAADEVASIRVDYPTYADWEHVVPAAFYLALDLIVRARETSPRPTPAAVVKEIGERRGWNVVEDATATLQLVEADLVSHGAVVLRDAPSGLAEEFAADDDERSFNDGISDVQRRLDYMAKDEFRPWFAKAAEKSARLEAEGKSVLRDAILFRQSREGRLAEQVKMTARRNILFTGLMDGLENERVVVGEVVKNEPDKLSRVEGTYWWNLSRLGRPAGNAGDDEEVLVDTAKAASVDTPSATAEPASGALAPVAAPGQDPSTT